MNPPEILFPQEQKQYTPASNGKRFSNYILDTIFFYIFAIIIGLIMGLVIGVIMVVTENDSLAIIFDEENKLAKYLMGFMIAMVYYSTFEAATGRTLGKYITGTKMINMEGEIPSYGRILLRTPCRFIPFEPFSFLFAETGWHDSLSKTKVVNVK